MIDELRIRDLGVIADATLPLGPGLSVVTGETGAGKTMVVTALGLLLGERADAGVVRAGADQASVEGVWRLPGDAVEIAERVDEAGGRIEDGELVLARTLARGPEGAARSRAFVGGRSAPAGVLAELGERLVVVHGQSEQLRLRSRAAQRDALDRFASAGELRAELATAFSRWSTAQTELDSLLEARERRSAEAAELRAAIERIEAVDPKPGEDEALAAEAERLSHLETLRQAAAEAHKLLSSESDESPDASALVGSARRAIERAADHDPALAPIAQALAELAYGLGDATVQLSGYLAGLDTDGASRLDAVQERRAELSELMRQHGPALDDVIAVLDSGSARLLELDRTDASIAELEDGVRAALEAAESFAGRLSALRRSGAERLAEAVSAELAALAMPDARLVVTVEPTERLSATGRDEIAFLLVPHPGAEPRPLGRGASGGELSRIMLALEVVLAGVDPVPTFVFDEVDAGVGGAAAIEIGRRLARLAEHAQVVVVTHLAQVAAFATNHLRVEKDTAGGFTESSVARLTGQEREREMARLLSGLADSESGLAHARELLALR
ncbi:MAG TPA: DNA repair protein RecN [Microbacteriaceae bacterium]|nr:DNA repair protein RecN [Microbacteriaceae bacterium]